MPPVMTPLELTLAAFATSVVAGVLGALLGLGGGIIVVPALTLLFGIDIRYAIGASIVSVIATSSGAAAAYVRERMTNLRVAMLLELGTTTGAMSGAYLAGLIGGRGSLPSSAWSWGSRQSRCCASAGQRSLRRYRRTVSPIVCTCTRRIMTRRGATRSRTVSPARGWA